MLGAVHVECGDQVTFMHDAENRYSFLSAVRVGRALEEMKFRWLSRFATTTTWPTCRTCRWRDSYFEFPVSYRVSEYGVVKCNPL